jgi:hypothetical protein
LRLLLCLVVLLATATSCGSKRTLYAPSARLAGGIEVYPYDIQIQGSRIYFHTHVANQSGHAILLSRDGWSLRLRSGRVLKRAVGVTTQHAPYVIHPGEFRRVFVDFRSSGDLVREADGAALIVGGISFPPDPAQYVVGELRVSASPLPQPVVVPATVVPATVEPPPVRAPEPVPSPPPTACVPGRSVECVGPDGCRGFQICAPGGDHFEPCQCTGPAP